MAVEDPLSTQQHCVGKSFLDGLRTVWKAVPDHGQGKQVSKPWTIVVSLLVSQNE
jgi:hypothetical protein